MKLIDGLEQNLLFRLTRILAILFICGVFVATVFGGFVLFTVTSKKPAITVQASEVIEALKPQQQKSSVSPEQQVLAPEGDPLANLKVPFALQKILDSENVTTIRNWLRQIPEDKQAQALEEMGLVAAAAEKSNVAVPDALNKYHELKMERFAAEEKAAEAQKYSVLIFGSSVATGIIVIALFSLILVLLAVERNTRPAIK